MVDPQAGKFLLDRVSHVTKEGARSVRSHGVHIHVIHAVVELGGDLMLGPPFHGGESVVLGVVEAGEHHGGGVVTQGAAEHVLVLEFMAAEGSQGGHVVPSEENFAGVCHVPMVHGMRHPVPVIVLIGLGMTDRFRGHVMRRRYLVTHERMARVHERIYHLDYETMRETEYILQKNKYDTLRNDTPVRHTTSRRDQLTRCGLRSGRPPRWLIRGSAAPSLLAARAPAEIAAVTISANKLRPPSLGSAHSTRLLQ